MRKRRIPVFRSEAAEAAWWYKNRARHDKEFFAALKEGKVRRLTRRKLRARIKAATKVVSIRIAREDVELARKQAARLGLRYQTYVKSLLHRALRKNA